MSKLILTGICAFGLMGAGLGSFGPENPAREPQLAASGKTVVMTFGAGNTIYFSLSRDAGKTFSAPVKVAQGEVLPLNRHRGPHIALAGNNLLITAVAGKTLSTGQHAHGLPTDGDLLVWRSSDLGKTWSKGSIINDVPGAPTEGLHGLAGDAHGNFFAAWLDHRGDKGTKLYGARSTDGGATWSKNVLLYQSPEGTICECCHPSVAIDADGQIEVMFRNWLGGSRDLYLMRSRDGVQFSAPEKLGNGTWQLNACPMDGGGLVSSGGRTITAWRRAEEVYLAEPGHEEVLLGKGKDVALGVAGGHARVLWSQDGKVEAWADGKVSQVAEAGAFPAIVGLADGGMVGAWEQGGSIVTRRF